MECHPPCVTWLLISSIRGDMRPLNAQQPQAHISHRPRPPHQRRQRAQRQ
jgi:hypothetical protein